MGSEYTNTVLASMHEQVQFQTWVLGGVNTPKGGENPVPKPQSYPRPDDVFRGPPELPDMTDAEFDTQF